MRKLSSIGLVLMVALGLTAVAGASAAGASQFRAQRYPTTVNASQATTQKITFGSSILKCTSVNGAAAESAPSSTLEVTPSFSGCAMTGVAANVTTNGCRLLFSSTNEAAPFAATLGVLCGAGHSIEVSQGGCVVSIPAQSSVPGVELTNGGSGASQAVTVGYTVGKLAYSQSSGCAGGLGTFSNGSITGTSLLKGSTGSRPSGVYVGGQQLSEGPQFMGSSYPMFVSGSGSFQWNLHESGFISKCQSNFNGGLATASSEVSMEVNVFGCSYAGIAATVNMNGCKFAEYLNRSEGSGFNGGREISCPTGKEVTFSWPGCTLSVPAQNASQASFYSNVATTPKSLTSSGVAGGLKYSGGPGCPSNVAGPHEDLEIRNSWTVKGFRNENGVEGVQINLWVQ